MPQNTTYSMLWSQLNSPFSILELWLPSVYTELLFSGQLSPCSPAWASGGRPFCLYTRAKHQNLSLGKRFFRHAALSYLLLLHKILWCRNLSYPPGTGNAWICKSMSRNSLRFR
jgi:hypothetical protein